MGLEAHINTHVILDAEVKGSFRDLASLPGGAPDIVQGLPVRVWALDLDCLYRSSVSCILHAVSTF